MLHLLWPCGFSPSPLPLGLNFPFHRPGGPVSIETLQHVALFDKCKSFTKARELQAVGLYPYFRPISHSEDTVVVIEGKERIMMGSNNYLGLTHHPEVLAAAKQALERYGSGCTGSRLLNGTLDLHERLEHELAQFFGKEACLVFSTGYQANLGLISGLVGRGDVVFLDKLDHASIVDGATMSYGETWRFNHGDLANLERKLQFFFSSRRRHTRCSRDWSSDVCSSDLECKESRSRRSPWPALLVPLPTTRMPGI